MASVGLVIGLPSFVRLDFASTTCPTRAVSLETAYKGDNAVVTTIAREETKLI